MSRRRDERPEMLQRRPAVRFMAQHLLRRGGRLAQSGKNGFRRDHAPAGIDHRHDRRGQPIEARDLGSEGEPAAAKTIPPVELLRHVDEEPVGQGISSSVQRITRR